MNDDVKNNIFYHPKVDIERDYNTSGSISHINDSNTDNDNNFPITDLEETLERAEKVQDDLLQIRKVLDILPKKTAEILKDLVDKLIFQSEDEKKKIKEIPPDDKKKDNTDNPPGNDDKGTPDTGSTSSDTINDGPITFWKDPDPIDIEITVVKAKENNELAYEQYLKDSIAIKEDFAYKLNSVMQDYIYPLITVMGELGLDSKEYLTLDYEGESVTGVDNDDKHLHDKIVRNQTIIDEKNRKFMKTHSANNSLAIMSAFDIVSQQRVKYYAEEYDLGINSFAGIYKRNMLEDSRKEYEAKYGRAKVNMYKYLNSSAVITGDILKKTLEVDAAKCYLLSKNVNIYARKRYEASGYENNTDNTTIDLEKDADKANSTILSSSSNSNSSTNNKNSNGTNISEDKKNTVSNVTNSTISSRLNEVLGNFEKETNNTVKNATTETAAKTSEKVTSESDKIVSNIVDQIKNNFK